MNNQKIKSTVYRYRWFLIIAFFALVAVTLGFLFNKKPVQGSLIIYTSLPQDAVNSVKNEFKQNFPRVDVRILRDSTSNILTKIYKEVEISGKTEADLVWVADRSNTEELKNKNLLQKYTSLEAKNIIPIFVDSDGYYIGTRLLLMGLIYNTQLLKYPPRSYQDLLKPEFKDMCSLVDYTSGSSFYAAGVLLEMPGYGEEYFSKLVKNNCKSFPSNPTLIENIAQGSSALGVAISSNVDLYLATNANAPISYVLPAEGVIAVSSPIAITRDAQNLVPAKAFIDWILSKSGQSLLSTIGIVPVRTDVFMPGNMVPLQELKIIPSDAKKILADKVKIESLLKEIPKK